MAALLGCSNETPILTISQQRPISKYKAWVQWLLKPLGCTHRSPVSIPDLGKILSKLQQLSQL